MFFGGLPLTLRDTEEMTNTYKSARYGWTQMCYTASLIISEAKTDLFGKMAPLFDAPSSRVITQKTSRAETTQALRKLCSINPDESEVGSTIDQLEKKLVDEPLTENEDRENLYPILSKLVDAVTQPVQTLCDNTKLVEPTKYWLWGCGGKAVDVCWPTSVEHGLHDDARKALRCAQGIDAFSVPASEAEVKQGETCTTMPEVKKSRASALWARLTPDYRLGRLPDLSSLEDSERQYKLQRFDKLQDEIFTAAKALDKFDVCSASKIQQFNDGNQIGSLRSGFKIYGRDYRQSFEQEIAPRLPETPLRNEDQDTSAEDNTRTRRPRRRAIRSVLRI